MVLNQCKPCRPTRNGRSHLCIAVCAGVRTVTALRLDPPILKGGEYAQYVEIRHSVFGTDSLHGGAACAMVRFAQRVLSVSRQARRPNHQRWPVVCSLAQDQARIFHLALEWNLRRVVFTPTVVRAVAKNHGRFFHIGQPRLGLTKPSLRNQIAGSAAKAAVIGSDVVPFGPRNLTQSPDPTLVSWVSDSVDVGFAEETDSHQQIINKPHARPQRKTAEVSPGGFIAQIQAIFPYFLLSLSPKRLFYTSIRS